ncbi:hypothetical protein GYMLUDRAFT_59506 [Collybiopsis luxurians FD-317 M1]|uniref:Protein kinase domain-containing protein n=1 Tax=Collybiopsis luxurians FD-317 M1 TaxID=944289 RepID=A0A0D0CCZ2_9AGAR|nr:hypothetical protein GYMLUDRAFT_59506 [Collybiopsis luxurians FD-317 M1]
MNTNELMSRVNSTTNESMGQCMNNPTNEPMQSVNSLTSYSSSSELALITESYSSSDFHDETNFLNQYHVPYHPSDVINRWILENHIEVDVAITHDEDWASVIEGHENEMPWNSGLIQGLKRHLKRLKTVQTKSYAYSCFSEDEDAISLQTDSSTTMSLHQVDSGRLDSHTTPPRSLSRPSTPAHRAKAYHTLQSSFGKAFRVEKRWKFIREMGSGAYGVVISATDEISGETVAIKLVTGVSEKVQLAKRALREIVLLRHFAAHENITGLIDVDAISPDFDEIYIFMEVRSCLLPKKSPSTDVSFRYVFLRSPWKHLTSEHVQYFLYQILRGMKYIHSAHVLHRDLKPGNLLVNADCELKICDFGLSRGFDAVPDENASHLTEYVATRWYRAPEIMLAFRRYNTASMSISGSALKRSDLSELVDVWSIGCIFAELLLGKPLFKGKDYVDQLNKILNVLGSPDDAVIQKIGSNKAQAYVKSLPSKKTVPLVRIIPHADVQALDLLKGMLSFDPDERITVPEALEHPWLAAYHDVNDEPECTQPFDKWRYIETLETIDDFRDALWNEIQEYRREVRGSRLKG